MNRIEFTNFSSNLFMGFYETFLDYDLNEGYYKIPEGYHFEYTSWNDYCNAVGKEATRIIWNSIGNDVINNIEFKGIDSPRFYNFETDKLVLNIDYNDDALKDYCFKDFREEFDEYLKDNFTSRDGFISFIPNNVKDFEEMDDQDRMVQIMIEFYLLDMIDLESYEADLHDAVCEIVWEYACLEDDKGNRFDYSIDDYNDCIKVEKPLNNKE